MYGLLIEYIYLLILDFIFVNEFFCYVKFFDIIFEVKLFLREVILNNMFEIIIESYELGKVYVVEVMVICEKK